MRLQLVLSTTGMTAEDDIDVASFLASPRHAYWFLSSEDATKKILERASSMLTTEVVSIATMARE